MRISDWSSDVCSSDLLERLCHGADGRMAAALVLQAPQEEDGMKRIRLTPLFFRRIHKWVGLILGLQFLLWALSGSVMALLDKDKVGGHGGEMSHAQDRKSTRLNSSPYCASRMTSSACKK